MVRYEFFEGKIQQLANGTRSIFIDCDTLEVFEEVDDVQYLFERHGMGGQNPLMSDEEKEERYGV